MPEVEVTITENTVEVVRTENAVEVSAPGPQGASGGTASLTQGTLAGRGASSGTGQYEQITLGTGLSMSGTTLNAAGGDHGTLTGLSDDDHPQYHTDARGDARYSQLGHTHAASDITSGTINTARLGSGTANSSTYLRGDQTWQPVVVATTDLTYTASTRLLESSTGADVTLPLVTSGNAGLSPASGGGTTNFLRADGTWTAPPGTTNLSWTASTQTVGSSTGTGAVITTFTSSNAGLTPNSGGGTTNFLRADGTWTAPPGSTDLSWTASTRTVGSSTGTGAVISIFTSSNAGLTPNSGGGTTNFLRADATWAAPPGSTDLSWTASTRTVSSSTGAGAVITLFTSSNAGLTPNSGGGTTNFLRADGTWASPPGTTNHGSLTGLSSDDHTQYIYNAPASSTRNIITPTSSDLIGLTVDSGSRSLFGSADAFRVRNPSSTAVFQVTITGSGISPPNAYAVIRGGWQIYADPSTSFCVTILSPTLSAGRTITLPPTASDSGAALKATDSSGTTQWYPEGVRGIFGDGYEGDFTTSGNITLTRPRFWNNLTVATGHTITTGGYRIHVKETLTLSGTGAIRRDGNSAGNASGASGGSAATTLTGTSTGGSGAGTGGVTATTGAGAQATAVTSLSNSMGVSNAASNSGAGGSGGSGAGGAARSGGSVTTREMRALTLHLIDGATLLVGSNGGAGGGSGAGDGVNTGGGGGGGGGGAAICFIIARSIVVGASAAITANGGSGGKGGNSSAGNTGGGGGGAGGAGGVVYLIYETLSNSGTISANGGAGGAVGTGFGTGTSGTSGNNGQAGYVLKFNTLKGAWE